MKNRENNNIYYVQYILACATDNNYFYSNTTGLGSLPSSRESTSYADAINQGRSVEDLPVYVFTCLRFDLDAKTC